MSDIDDRDDRRRDLANFANAGAQQNQPVPHGHQLVRPTSGISERIIGAQPVAKERDEAKILTKLSALAAAAGTDWFYRFPVKKKEGGQDWIEGPSIKLANDVARIFGNDVIEIREIDVGDAWIFYARFTDIETGFSMERAYRQRKSQTSIKTQSGERQQDIAYQIGQSKAIRNVIVNSLQIYADHAFNEARGSLVEKIGKNIEAWRERILLRLSEIPVEINRVERAIGRSAKDWLAPHIAQVAAMWKSIDDKMASVDEVFPPLETIELAKEGATVATGESSKAGPGEPQAAAETDQVQAPDQSTASPAASQDIIDTAYRRGQEAKAAGASRKAVPPEYREEPHARLGLAWVAGWDNSSKPVQ